MRKTGTASGRFLLRIPPGLHASLKAAARAAGLSLNDYCTRKLAGPEPTSLPGGTQAVLRATELLGPDLVGLAAFGSWARDEATDRSDIDLLVAVEPRVALTRELYRRWDERALRWNGREVEPHFVHLPEPLVTVAGLWGEVAIDGIVLFERDLALSTRLARVRRDIAEGRIVRRTVHGQGYWTEVA